MYATGSLVPQRAGGYIIRHKKGPPGPGDQIAILSSLVARKATFLLALIWIGSPVAGLRPMWAARFRA